ncbi:NAD(P)-binding protein [Nakamurella sp. YIM 132087]|uniref:NAD(P)-binding protein n=1 Tax=Nakamurella alba TaxID=2665158 RepID=A0A7K1FJ73_9ACTN|nr:NAD(P)/FAD-dependent oxidoreductase [Nakamurella alba]MTD14185.1 NAD(P)-binding protein [Nakamurella alba]
MIPPDTDLDRDRLVEAIGAAHLPVLVPLLYQLTGDERWLGEAYRPAKIRGFDLQVDGGFSDDVQAEIRQAVVDAVAAWHAGRPAAVPRPTDDVLTTLMSTSLGERVPASVAPIVAEQSGFAPYVPQDVSGLLAASGRDFSVVIVGAGVSGLLAAINCARAGIPFTVLEKNSEVGGTWWENRYPGVRVDIPSDLYSVSYAPGPWSEMFARQPEIARYFTDLADSFGIREHIRFGVEARRAIWDQEAGTWKVVVAGADGREQEVTGTALVTAVGLHNRPKIPDLPGRDEFRGRVVHSAQWPDDLDLRGRKVAVLGSGATAMQLVCAIADETAQLTVLQRTPQWVSPHPDYFSATGPHHQWLFDHVPFYRSWYRFRLFWVYSERLYGLQAVDPEWSDDGRSVNALNQYFRSALTSYLTAQLRGRGDLIEATLPDFPVMGKRLLLDNGWFSTIRRDDVELLRTGIAELTATEVVTTDGDRREIDTLVLCTGFAQQRFLFPMELTGRDGHSLREEWHDDDGRAYLGITSPGFPNLFHLFGPNTNPPGGSFITVAEAQARYISELLVTMVRDDLASVECREEPFRAYNLALDEANTKMVYGIDGVQNYYRNAAGRVVTNSPWPVPEYWRMTHRPDLADFDVAPVLTPSARRPPEPVR